MEEYAMFIEEYGKENSRTIVMLHGAFFVHIFGRQYSLSSQYHLIVPHIMGFGNNTEHIFETDACIQELADYIKSLRAYLKTQTSYINCTKSKNAVE